MLGGEAVGAFELDEEDVFDEKVGEIVADVVTFVDDGQRGLGGGADAAEGEFLQQGSLVDLFEETGAEGIGHFECGAEDAFREGLDFGRAG